jgi:Ca2+-binding RTX toxin-like protein
MYQVDLDKDGVNELVYVAMDHTYSGTFAEHKYAISDSYVHMFKFSQGILSDVTDKLLPDAKIGGSTNLCVGDFNGDGRVDMFIPSATDTNVNKLSDLYLGNASGKYTHQTFDLQVFIHDATVTDINRDGCDDVVMGDQIAFGGPNGFNFKKYQDSFQPPNWKGPWSGSGVCVADFMGNGTLTLLFTDDTSTGFNSTNLYSWRIDADGKLYLDHISTLPTPIFDTAPWASYGFENFRGQFGASHDVRVFAFKFQGDSLTDAIVISRPALTNGVWPEYTAIQFLKNLGGGNFEDVTSRMLPTFDYNLGASPYQPVVADYTGDGLLDIFLSGADDVLPYSSTALLMQQADGTFVEAGKQAFTALFQQAQSLARALPHSYFYENHGTPIALVKNDAGDLTAVMHVVYADSQGLSREAFFTESIEFGGDSPVSTLSKITGTIGNDKLMGTTDDDHIYGLAGNDTLTGLAGDDTLDGGAGNDSMVGGAGDDTYYVDSTGDKVVELANQGTDTVKTSLASYTLGSNVENLTHTGPVAFKGTGNILNNSIVGSLGSDILTGLAGNDTIQGGAGSDQLLGGSGNDVLTGGAGSDYFVFDAAPGATNIDAITDFETGLDKIRLSKSMFKISSSIKFSDQFVVGTQAQDKYDRIIYDSAANKLYYDADGIGKIAPVQFAEVSTVGVTKLTSNDFVLF